MKQKKNSQTKKILFIAAPAAILVLIGAWALRNYWLSPRPAAILPSAVVPVEQENNLLTGESAVTLALTAARQWRADAELSYLIADEVGQIQGRSNNWQLIFVSPSVKGKGYLVKIIGAQIADTEEISYNGMAAELPAQTITQAEAVAKVRAMPGYQNVKILGVGMIYGASVKTWYWGVKTDKGTVTVAAGSDQ